MYGDSKNYGTGDQVTPVPAASILDRIMTGAPSLDGRR